MRRGKVGHQAEEEQELLAMSNKKKSNVSQLAQLRMDSCVMGDEEASAAAMMLAMRRGDLHFFTEIVNNEEGVDVNQEVAEEAGGDVATPLYHAIKAGRDEFVEVLLRHRECDPNRTHGTDKRFPIHVAAETANKRVLALLLRAGADANAKMENGSTALHVLAARSAGRWRKEGQGDFSDADLMRRFVECARLLLKEASPPANLDSANNIGVTPVKMAAEKGSEEFASFLLDLGAYVDGETEDMLEDRMPDMLAKKDLSRNKTNRDTAENRLFHALYDEKDDGRAFVDKWKEAATNNNNIDLNASDGCYTFLQLACDRGMVAVARFLLESGADPGAVTANLATPPLVLAGHHGYHRVLALFRDAAVAGNVDFGATDAKGENVLHRVLKAESKAYHNHSERNYDKCLAMLLDSRKPAVQMMIQPAIDGQDDLGNTPLHVAAYKANDDAVKRLLRCGANIGICNKNGQTPIENIDPAIMEDFLDECLYADGAPVDTDFKLMFKYAFLAPQLNRQLSSKSEKDEEEGDVKESERDKVNLLPEAEPLFHLSQSPRHRHLLTHPVVSSFLCLKWRRIRPYYYVNLTFYLTFVASLTAYLLLGATNDESDAVTFFKWTTLALLVVLTFRELLQAMVSCWRYWSSPENLMEVCMLACTYLVLLCDCGPKVATCLSGAALILSWAEMVLMFGRHPKLSTFITMFSTVSLNFFYFLTWYLSIILAFGLTFFILLHRDGRTDDGGEELNSYFSSPSRSLYKTVVMSLTGEIEFEGIDFGGLFAIFVFLAYVFFVMLVLVNLLNGLAVSDIAEIQKHAEVVSHVSRVELISYMESMLLGDPFSFLSNRPSLSFSSSRRRRRLPDGSCVGRGLYALSPVRRLLGAVIGNTLLFQQRLRLKMAVFVPNKTSYEDSLPGSSHDDLRLERGILQAATDIVASRERNRGDVDERIQKIEDALKLVARQNNHIIEMLQQQQQRKH